jgi:hypothetical protein
MAEEKKTLSLQEAMRHSHCQGTLVVVSASQVSASHDLYKGGAGDLVCRILAAVPV